MPLLNMARGIPRFGRADRAGLESADTTRYKGGKERNVWAMFLPSSDARVQRLSRSWPILSTIGARHTTGIDVMPDYHQCVAHALLCAS